MVKRWSVSKVGVPALLVLSALAAGCGDKVDPAAPVEQQGEVMEILRTLPPEMSGGLTEPTRKVVKDVAALQGLWKRASSHRAPLPAEPPVDFTKEMFALASLGQKPTGGYSVEIVGIRQVGGKLRILVSERAPEPGEVVPQVITQPWHAVVIPRTDDEVEWMEYVPPSKR